jgi:hypothetical protein
MVSLVSLSPDQLAGAHATQVHSSPEDMEFNRIKTTYANMNGDFAPEAMASTFLSATPALDTLSLSLSASADASVVDADFEVVDGTTIFFDSPPQTSDNNGSSKSIEPTVMNDLNVVVTEAPPKPEASPKTEIPVQADKDGIRPSSRVDYQPSPSVSASNPEVEKTSPQAFNEAPSTAPPTNPAAPSAASAQPKVDASQVDIQPEKVEPTNVEADSKSGKQLSEDPKGEEKVQVGQEEEQRKEIPSPEELKEKGEDVEMTKELKKVPEKKIIDESELTNEVETGEVPGNAEKLSSEERKEMFVQDDNKSPKEGTESLGNDGEEKLEEIHTEKVKVDNEAIKEEPDIDTSSETKYEGESSNNEKAHELALEFKKDGKVPEPPKDELLQPLDQKSVEESENASEDLVTKNLSVKVVPENVMTQAENVSVEAVSENVTPTDNASVEEISENVTLTENASVEEVAAENVVTQTENASVEDVPENVVTQTENASVLEVPENVTQTENASVEEVPENVVTQTEGVTAEKVMTQTEKESVEDVPENVTNDRDEKVTENSVDKESNQVQNENMDLENVTGDVSGREGATEVVEPTPESVTEAPISSESTGFFGNFFGSSEPDRIPTSTEYVPTSTESVPTSTESVPTSTESVPTSTESIPTSTESVPTVEEPLPNFENPSVTTEASSTFDQPPLSFSSDEIKFYNPGQVPEDFLTNPAFDETRQSSDQLGNNVGKTAVLSFIIIWRLWGGDCMKAYVQ